MVSVYSKYVSVSPRLCLCASGSVLFVTVIYLSTVISQLP